MMRMVVVDMSDLDSERELTALEARALTALLATIRLCTYGRRSLRLVGARRGQ
jgi:hypothetical protein